jgi:parvulin-like peptidyl-prolyl isomerase
MRRASFLLVSFFILIGGTVVAQDRPASSADASPSPLTATGVAPGDVVISIDGICDREFLIEGSTRGSAEKSKPAEASPGGHADASAAAAGHDSHAPECKTEVTRAQFEKFINLLEPTLKRSDRIRVAVRYAEGLVFAERGKQIGLDKDPRTQVGAQYSNLLFLSGAFNRYLQTQAAQLSDAEVKTYYEQNPELFIKANFLRIFVPNERKHSDTPSTPKQVEERQAADEAAMKSLATKIRARAVAGADFQALEEEVYQFAGEPDSQSPDVDLDDITRKEAPQELQPVFDLKPGEISEVISAPKGWHIVKMVSRQTTPLSDARSMLQSLRFQEALDSAKHSAPTKFNDAYFNTPNGMDPVGGTSIPK